jgi:hypothetical protein
MHKCINGGRERTVHFTDDLSRVPEKYRRDAESRKTIEEISAPEPSKNPLPPLAIFPRRQV